MDGKQLLIVGGVALAAYFVATKLLKKPSRQDAYQAQIAQGDLVQNNALPGQPGWAWTYYDDGVAISPDGTYYKDGVAVWGASKGAETWARM